MNKIKYFHVIYIIYFDHGVSAVRNCESDLTQYFFLLTGYVTLSTHVHNKMKIMSFINFLFKYVSLAD